MLCYVTRSPKLINTRKNTEGKGGGAHNLRSPKNMPQIEDDPSNARDRVNCTSTLPDQSHNIAHWKHYSDQ